MNGNDAIDCVAVNQPLKRQIEIKFDTNQDRNGYNFGDEHILVFWHDKRHTSRGKLGRNLLQYVNIETVFLTSDGSVTTVTGFHSTGVDVFNTLLHLKRSLAARLSFSPQLNY